MLKKCPLTAMYVQSVVSIALHKIYSDFAIDHSQCVKF